jgi:hypothetical protein
MFGSLATPRDLIKKHLVIVLSLRAINVIRCALFVLSARSSNHEPTCFRMALFRLLARGFNHLLVFCVYLRERRPVVALGVWDSCTQHGLACKEWRLDFRLAIGQVVGLD